ncbi:MAG: radical SAM protein [Candidatus Omnitrophica bacterium]|nr:radical SAM protein [Candidatus Omnitrophota bacterium]MDD5027088.1 radical SAM protein [Candidatus Omnitrophota bacterium]
MISWIKEFRFYRHLFRLGNIGDALKDYLLYSFAQDNRKTNLLSLNFLITSMCNLGCSICSFSGNLNPAAKGISVSDFEKFIGSIPGRSKPVLFFSGGEPFLRQDIFDILKVTKKYGFQCGVNTNGTLLDEVKINRLIKSGVELVIFSIYGPQHIHDAITLVKGSYAKVLEAVRLTCAKKTKRTKVILSCAITRQGLDTLETIPFIAKDLGVDAVKFEHLNFITSQELKNTRLGTLLADSYNSPDGFSKKLAERLAEVRKKYGNFVLIKPDLSSQEIENWYTGEFHTKRKCFFVWHSLFIRPDGVVTPCQFLLDYELGDIKKQSPEEIFNNVKIFGLRKTLRRGLLPECCRCCKL